MPYEICIPLSSDTLTRPQPGHQRAAHALFFAALKKADPGLADTIHHQFHKPFTQALLSKNEHLLWRITLLDDTLHEPLCLGLSQLENPRLHEVNIHLHLAEATWQQCAYTEFAAALPPSRYAFTFLTPTTFKQKVFLNPLPDVASCFQSWWTRWQTFAPPDLGINIAVLDIAAAHLMTGSFRLSSHSWSDGRRPMIGATGFTTFLPYQREQIEDHWWHNLATLAAFAPYSGTGYKTTQGCGQTTIQP